MAIVVNLDLLLVKRKMKLTELAGRVDIDLVTEPLGKDQAGKDVFLKDLWPTLKEVRDHMAGADLGALVALADRAVALEIDGDLGTAAVQVLGVRRAGPEDGVKHRRVAAVLAGDGQPEF